MQWNTFFLACFFICVNWFSQQYPSVHSKRKDVLVDRLCKRYKARQRGGVLFTIYVGLSIYHETGCTDNNRQVGSADELVNDIA